MIEGSDVLVAVHGLFVVDMDERVSKNGVLLKDPVKSLLLQTGVWSRTHSYKDECVALILASEEYDRGRYVYDYEEWTWLRKQYK